MQKQPAGPMTRDNMVNVLDTHSRRIFWTLCSLLLCPLGRVRNVIVPTPAVHDAVLTKFVGYLANPAHQAQLLQDPLRVRKQDNTGALWRDNRRSLLQQHEIDSGRREYVRGHQADRTAADEYDAKV